MLDFITSHPLYIPFLVINGLIIYEVIKIVRNRDNGEDDDDNNNDGGSNELDDPVLDLPPGVTLPVSPKEPVFSE